MAKKKQNFCLENMPIVKSKKAPHLHRHNPSDFFKSHEKVTLALTTSLEEGNTGTFLEILNVYLQIEASIASRKIFSKCAGEKS
jgi:hypothetical protein